MEREILLPKCEPIYLILRIFVYTITLLTFFKI
jgi:hypothetical protein